MYDEPIAVETNFNLASLARMQQRRIRQRQFSSNHIENYLGTSVTQDESPLEFWKTKEHEMPGLAQMAKDVLVVPIAGVGIERLFNTARNICSYRRYSLNPETIRELMLVRHHDGLLDNL